MLFIVLPFACLFPQNICCNLPPSREYDPQYFDVALGSWDQLLLRVRDVYVNVSIPLVSSSTGWSLTTGGNNYPQLVKTDHVEPTQSHTSASRVVNTSPSIVVWIHAIFAKKNAIVLQFYDLLGMPMSCWHYSCKLVCTLHNSEQVEEVNKRVIKCALHPYTNVNFAYSSVLSYRAWTFCRWVKFWENGYW